MAVDIQWSVIDKHYDWSLNSSGDFTNKNSFDSQILYALLGEQRATESEIPVSENRRGWIGNEGKDFENGSKIWLYEQARLTRSTLNGVKDSALDALQYFVNENLIDSITVEAEFTILNIRLQITLFRFNSPAETKFFNVWDNTGS